MTEDRKLLDGFQPGRGYSRDDWNEVSDTPELTDEELSRARPFSEVFPALAESIKRSRGRPPAERTKQQVTLRLDAEIIDRFKAGGPGWQSRMNEALRKSIGM